MICCFVNRHIICKKDIVCRKLQNGDCHFLKKVAQKLFIALRGKILRKSCCVATQNNFEGILTGALKIEDLLPYK